MAIEIRFATIEDGEQIQAIYEPIVLETAISSELAPPTVADFQERVTRTLKTTPWRVYDVERTVAGYPYAGQYQAREA